MYVLLYLLFPKRRLESNMFLPQWRRNWPRYKWWQEWHYEFWVCEWKPYFCWSYSFLDGPPFLFWTPWWLLIGDKDVRGAEYFLQGHSGGSLFDKQLGLQKHGISGKVGKNQPLLLKIFNLHFSDILVNIRNCSTWRWTQTRLSYFGANTHLLTQLCVFPGKLTLAIHRSIWFLPKKDPVSLPDLSIGVRSVVFKALF